MSIHFLKPKPFVTNPDAYSRRNVVRASATLASIHKGQGFRVPPEVHKFYTPSESFRSANLKIVVPGMDDAIQSGLLHYVDIESVVEPMLIERFSSLQRTRLLQWVKSRTNRAEQVRQNPADLLLIKQAMIHEALGDLVDAYDYVFALAG
jgi:hypothetical protein